MKILIVVPTFATYPFLRRFCERLAELDCEVHWASSNFKFQHALGDSFPFEQHVINFPRGANITGHLSAARSLRRLVASINPDFIDVHFSAAMLTAAIAKRKYWPPIVATVQGLRFTSQTGARRTFERMIECWAARQMDELVVLTHDDLAALSKRSLKLPQARLQESAGFGCDLTRFNRDQISVDKRGEARQHAGVMPGEIVFIYVGRRIAFKGYPLVVRAFKQALESQPDIRLIVCGSADDYHSSGLTAEEERYVSSHPQISELGWRDDVEKFLAISDVTLFPSRREGMPVNLMESLSMGVPVVTCDARGCREIVEDQVTGLVLPDFDVDRFSKAILQLAADENLRNRFSKNALAIRLRFDQNLFANERISAIQRLTGKQIL